MKSSEEKQPAILVRPRVYIGDKISIGPGKVDLLRLVGETRSIAAAARSLGIPYKKAWLLIDSLNEGFGRPVVETATGGKGGGGSTLTILGQQLVDRYGALEASLNAISSLELQALSKLAE